MKYVYIILFLTSFFSAIAVAKGRPELEVELRYWKPKTNAEIRFADYDQGIIDLDKNFDLDRHAFVPSGKVNLRIGDRNNVGLVWMHSRRSGAGLSSGDSIFNLKSHPVGTDIVTRMKYSEGNIYYRHDFSTPKSMVPGDVNVYLQYGFYWSKYRVTVSSPTDYDKKRRHTYGFMPGGGIDVCVYHRLNIYANVVWGTPLERDIRSKMNRVDVGIKYDINDRIALTAGYISHNLEYIRGESSYRERFKIDMKGLYFGVEFSNF